MRCVVVFVFRMPCVNPFYAYEGKVKEIGKKNLVFKRKDSWKGEKINLRCGKCVDCKLEYARQWAVRCLNEASLYENNCWLTLTYSPEKLPVGGSLDKEHLQKFLKRLRKNNGEGIRYYACGEYGELFERPHYHCILFNFDFVDKSLFKVDGEKKFYVSEELDRTWGKGQALIGDVTSETTAYTARYVMKKVSGKKSEEHYQGRVPEFTMMSRGSKKLKTGGIGKGWYEKWKTDIFPHDYMVINGFKHKPPKYYLNLLDKEDQSNYNLVKIKREIEGYRRRNETDSFRLPVIEECKLAMVKRYERPLEVLK